MMTRLVGFALAGLLSCAACAENLQINTAATFAASDIILADTRGKERRDDRDDNRDGRKDCRQDEGRVGDDKRDCKQDQRRGDGDDA